MKHRFFGPLSFAPGKLSVLIYSACVAALMASGCTANRYETPVSSFRDRTQQTVNVLSSYYASRNSYEVHLYLQTIATDPRLAVETTDRSGAPTPLGKPMFSPVSIKARLDALNLVGVYANRLYDLANSSAPAQFQSAATALGQNLGSLDKTFQTLQGASDPTANKFIGPISSLIGTIGEMYLDKKRDELVTKAIKDGAPNVDAILAQVRDDMEKIFSLEVTTGSSESLATLIRSYNNERSNLSYEQRTVRLAEIEATASAVAASVGSAPTAVVNSMIDAHKALVQEAQSSQKLRMKNLAALNQALEQWTNQLQILSMEIRPLIH